MACTRHRRASKKFRLASWEAVDVQFTNYLLVNRPITRGQKAQYFYRQIKEGGVSKAELLGNAQVGPALRTLTRLACMQ